MHYILVCDDNVAFLNRMVYLLEKYANLYDATIMGFDNGKDLMEYCLNHQYDIVYMDIEIGKENGMKLAKTLKMFNPKLLTIYISAYETYYVDMVQAEPFHFILKSEPHTLEKQVVDTLNAAMNRLHPRDIWTFSFRREHYSVELSKIVYFQSMARTIRIVGKTDGIPNYFYGKIDDIENEVKRIDEKFVRISKSVIVNKKYAGRYGRTQVKVGDKIFSVTKKYRDKLDDSWMLIIR